MTSIPLQCRCGQVKGTAHDINPRKGLRVVCCCDSCQEFANHLGQESITLDQFGGTEVFQATQSQITVEEGQDKLHCLRLSKKGPLRWYTSCCNTPVANTVSAKMAFAGIIHTFMNVDNRDEILGPVKAYVQTQHAIGTPDYPTSSPKFPLGLIAKIIKNQLIENIKGRQTPSVFFGNDKRPRVKPIIVNL